VTYIRIYGICGLLRLVIDLVFTRFDRLSFKSRLRLIRRPVYIRGKKHISIGDGFTTGVGLRMDAYSKDDRICLKIGKNVEVNDYVHIGAINSVIIGDNVLIASKVFISDHNHGFYGVNGRHDHPDSIPKERELSHAPVVIEDNVWIGEFVSVLPGVTIGKGSIIGTMSVVTKDISPYSIAIGAPAKVIKKYNFETSMWTPV
jgi:acetyltransferase-like isoleucine patch superfamily enzyme